MNDQIRTTGIILTDAAAERVRRFLSQSNGAVGMRLGVKKTGCSGMAYVVDLAAGVDERDNVFESNGVKVVVDEKSLPYVDGTRIDFTSDGLNESFYYENPNVNKDEIWAIAEGASPSIAFAQEETIAIAESAGEIKPPPCHSKHHKHPKHDDECCD